MRQSLERCYEYGVDLNILFTDYRINRERLTKALVDLDILKITNLVEIILKVVVRTNGAEFFKLLLVRQEVALSATHFNCTMLWENLICMVIYSKECSRWELMIWSLRPEMSEHWQRYFRNWRWNGEDQTTRRLGKN